MELTKNIVVRSDPASQLSFLSSLPAGLLVAHVSANCFMMSPPGRKARYAPQSFHKVLKAGAQVLLHFLGTPPTQLLLVQHLSSIALVWAWRLPTSHAAAPAMRHATAVARKIIGIFLWKSATRDKTKVSTD